MVRQVEIFVMHSDNLRCRQRRQNRHHDDLWSPAQNIPITVINPTSSVTQFDRCTYEIGRTFWPMYTNIHVVANSRPLPTYTCVCAHIFIFILLVSLYEGTGVLTNSYTQAYICIRTDASFMWLLIHTLISLNLYSKQAPWDPFTNTV